MLTLKSVLFSLLFIVTAGIAVMGTLMSFRLHKKSGHPENQWLIYQQLFSWAFMLFGIWGSFAVMEMLNDLPLAPAVRNKIVSVHPLMGLPFLLASWYMLIRLFCAWYGRTCIRQYSRIYFITSLLLLPALYFAGTRTGNPADQEAIYRGYILIALLNLLINLFLFVLTLPGMKKRAAVRPEGDRRILYGYFILTAVCTTLVSTYAGNHAVVLFFTIFLFFACNLLLPVFVLSAGEGIKVPLQGDGGSFAFFCGKYEISKREAEIIREVCAGKSNREIAASLFITLQTVKDHLHRIFTKTGVANRVQLINLTGLK